MNVKELVRAINLVTAISSEKLRIVKLLIKKGMLLLSVNDKRNSTGVMEIPINYDKEELSIAFNSKYLLDVLANIIGENAVIKVESGSHAIMIEDSGNANSCFVLMPVQL